MDTRDALATSHRTAENRIDAEVTTLRRRFADGEITETEARHQVAILLLGSRIIPETIVGRYKHTDPALVSHLQEHVRRVIEDKVLAYPGPTPSTFDLTRSGSACGWMRQMMVRIASLEANKWRRRNQRYRQLDFEAFLAQANISDPTEDAGIIENADDIEHRYQKASRQARATTRITMTYAALLEAFGLPELSRPGWDRRERLLQQLNDDLDLDEGDAAEAHTVADDVLDGRPKGLAWQSLRAWFRAVRPTAAWGSNEPAPPAEAHDPDLMHLWDNLTSDQAETLLAFGTAANRARVIHVLALGAVSDRPLPSAREVRRFVVAVRDFYRESLPAEAAESLAQGFVDSECEATSQYSAQGPDKHRITEHQANRRRHLEDVDTVRDALGAASRDDVLGPLYELAERRDLFRMKAVAAA